MMAAKRDGLKEENSKGGKTIDGKDWQAELGDGGLGRSWLLNVGRGKGRS